MLAVTGGKGGTGKTTTALGLAAALVRQRRRPVVVDADRDMPNLDVVADATALPGVDVRTAADGRPLTDVLPPRGRQPVLVDCPAGGGTAATRPLRHATRALLVTTPTREAVEDAVKTAAMARALDTPVAGVVTNKCTTPPNGLADAFDAPILAAVPHVEEPLIDPAATAAYDDLATELNPGLRTTRQ